MDGHDILRGSDFLNKKQFLILNFVKRMSDYIGCTQGRIVDKEFRDIIFLDFNKEESAVYGMGAVFGDSVIVKRVVSLFITFEILNYELLDCASIGLIR